VSTHRRTVAWFDHYKLGTDVCEASASQTSQRKSDMVTHNMAWSGICAGRAMAGDG